MSDAQPQAPRCGVCAKPITPEHGCDWVISLTAAPTATSEPQSNRPIGEDAAFCSETCLKLWAHSGFKRPRNLLASQMKYRD